MEKAYLDLAGKWGCVVLFNYDVESEYDELFEIIVSFGVSPIQARRSLNILSAPNTGMCVSFPEVKMSLVMISKATSNDEFWSSVAHELYHATCSIIRFYGEGLDAEESAYTMGELMRQFVTEVALPCY